MESIISALFNHIVLFISSFGYWGIGIGMAIESACIPLPSEIIMPFGGYLVSRGVLNLYMVTLVGATGSLAGSVAIYYLGLKGGKHFLDKDGRHHLIRGRHVETATRWFARYGGAAVFFGRLLPGVRTFISLPVGMAAMDLKKFMAYTFMGSLPWCFFLTYAGYKLGQNWEALREPFKRADVIILIALLIVIAGGILYGRGGKPEDEIRQD